MVLPMSTSARTTIQPQGPLCLSKADPLHACRATLEQALVLGVDVKMVTGDQKLIAVEMVTGKGCSGMALPLRRWRQ